MPLTLLTQSSLPAWPPWEPFCLNGLDHGGPPWLFLLSLAFFGHCLHSLASPAWLLWEPSCLSGLKPSSLPWFAFGPASRPAIRRTILSKWTQPGGPPWLSLSFPVELPLELSFNDRFRLFDFVYSALLFHHFCYCLKNFSLLYFWSWLYIPGILIPWTATTLQVFSFNII